MTLAKVSRYLCSLRERERALAFTQIMYTNVGWTTKQIFYFILFEFLQKNWHMLIGKKKKKSKNIISNIGINSPIDLFALMLHSHISIQ